MRLAPGRVRGSERRVWFSWCGEENGGGDTRHIADLFGISVDAAARYRRVLDHDLETQQDVQ